MDPRELPPIDRHEATRRRGQAVRIARSFGFRGEVQYRHVYSQSGGAQFCVGRSANHDVLVVYAEAFERDRDPNDFSLRAIIAHECGHAALLRNPRLAAIVKKLPGMLQEEVIASLIGALLVAGSADAEALVQKATAELAILGLSPAVTIQTIERLQSLLRQIL
jgi:hypothetical protein